MQPDVVIHADAESLAANAARLIAEFVQARASRVVTVGMAGGSTPAATYEQLRHLDLPWDKVYAWVGDERFVAPDHPDNNGATIRRQLIDHTDATFFEVRWQEGASPATLAAAYERTLMEILDHDEGGPRPDLLLAGIGEDGHTLSLFPGTSALADTDRWFVENEVPQKNTWRLTATYRLAHRAEQTLVLVAGPGKAAALARIMDPGQHPPLPARGLMGGEARVTWLVDESAAAELRSNT